MSGHIFPHAYNLRRHVQDIHVKKGQFPNLVVSKTSPVIGGNIAHNRSLNPVKKVASVAAASPRNSRSPSPQSTLPLFDPFAAAGGNDSIEAAVNKLQNILDDPHLPYHKVWPVDTQQSTRNSPSPPGIDPRLIYLPQSIENDALSRRSNACTADTRQNIPKGVPVPGSDLRHVYVPQSIPDSLLPIGPNIRPRDGQQDILEGLLSPALDIWLDDGPQSIPEGPSNPHLEPLPIDRASSHETLPVDPLVFSTITGNSSGAEIPVFHLSQGLRHYGVSAGPAKGMDVLAQVTAQNLIYDIEKIVTASLSTGFMSNAQVATVLGGWAASYQYGIEEVVLG